MPRPPDDEWIGRLYDRHGAALYRYAVMVLADPAGAADVVQTVFVSLLRQRARPDFDERYLRRAVRNECYSALRRRRRDSPAGEEPALIEASTAGGVEPEERLALE